MVNILPCLSQRSGGSNHDEGENHKTTNAPQIWRPSWVRTTRRGAQQHYDKRCRTHSTPRVRTLLPFDSNNLILFCDPLESETPNHSSNKIFGSSTVYFFLKLYQRVPLKVLVPNLLIRSFLFKIDIWINQPRWTSVWLEALIPQPFPRIQLLFVCRGLRISSR